MPFVKVSLPEEQIELYWKSNFHAADVATIGSNGRPTVLLLHPLLLSCDFLDHQMNDPLLADRYNLIAFDFLACGKTKAPLYATFKQAAAVDNWVEAALIAAFCEALDLPPVHIFASMANSVHAAMRFAMLFPDKCLSLSLCQVTGLTETQESKDAYRDLMQTWIVASSLETLEDLITNFGYLFFSGLIETDEMDIVAAYWEMHLCPARLTNAISGGVVMAFRTSLNKVELASVKVPVLILQGGASVFHTPDDAHALAKDLVNVPGGAQVHVLPGVPESSSVPKKSAVLVNKHFIQFLESIIDPSETITASLDNTQSQDAPLSRAQRVQKTQLRMYNALRRSAELGRRPDMLSRNPLSVFAFSRETEAIQKLRYEKYVAPWAAIQKGGFDVTGPSGRPVRLFSERNDKDLLLEMPTVAISSAQDVLFTDEEDRDEKEIVDD